MIYTKGIGIIALKSELDAVLSLAEKPSSPESVANCNIHVVIKGGKMTVWACDGGSAVYHTVVAWNGKKQPSLEEHHWQISTQRIARIAKSMTPKDEVLFPVTARGEIVRYVVTDIDSKDVVEEGALDNYVTRQLDLNMDLLPDGAVRASTPAYSVTLDPIVTKSLEKISKAVGKGYSRYWIPASDVGRVYIQIDTAERFRSGEDPRWAVSMSCVDVEGFGETPIRDEDDFDASDAAPKERKRPTAKSKQITLAEVIAGSTKAPVPVGDELDEAGA